MRIALCADSESVRYPEILGLDGEELGVQPWLDVFTDAGEMRETILCGPFDEAWVVGSDGMEAINIAAALKKDRPMQRVLLVVREVTGSVQTRANRAGIDAVMTIPEFIEAYWECRRSAQLQPPALLAPQPDASQECLVWPAQAEPPYDESQVAEASCSLAAADSAAPAFAPPAFDAAGRAMLIPVLSGSGGCGKSTIAALAALMAARSGKRTALLDADFQFGDMHVALGVQEFLHADELFDDMGRLDAIAVPSGMPMLVGSLVAPERAEEAMGKLPTLLEALCARYDAVFVNTGSFWTEEHAVLLERSTKALLLVDQRPSSLRASRRALEICANCGIATAPLSVVLNRCGKGAAYTSVDVSCALNGMAVAEVKDGGSQVEELFSVGQLGDLLNSRNALVQSLQQLLAQSLPGIGSLGSGTEGSRRRTHILFGHAMKDAAGEGLLL